MCSVQESHLTVSAFSQEDRRRLPHDVDASFRKMTKKIIDSTQEGPRKLLSEFPGEAYIESTWWIFALD